MRKLKVDKKIIRIRGNPEKVYGVIEKKKTATVSELHKLIAINYNSLRSSVIILTKYGLIKRTGRGIYTLKAKTTDIN